MYDFSDLSQEELEAIAAIGGKRLDALKARADAALARGDTWLGGLWADRLQAEVDAIAIDLGIKG